MKTCFKCGSRKPPTEFYRHPRMADGRLGKCKECTKRDVSQNYRKNITHYKKYEKGRAMLEHRVKARAEYIKTPAGYAAMIRGQMKWQHNNPIAKSAHGMVRRAVVAGRLIRQPCSVCGTAKHVHAHHEDYFKPLDVIWLCAYHHRKHHFPD